MSYLSDYILYNSGTECPDEYLRWAALSLLGAIAGGKVWVEHGDRFRFHPNLFVCLVGDPASGKNTAMSCNKDVMVEHFPHLHVSASIQSREDIADIMASDGCCKTWKDVKGEYGLAGAIYEYRPFYILNNELASFLSVDKGKTVEFLVDVFDSKYFGTGFKGQRRENPNAKQWFANPHLSLIAGAVPTWFMHNLKLDLFSGGLGSRLIIVNSKSTKVIDDPRRPPGAKEALARVISHLKQVESEDFYGRVRRTPDAMNWFKDWYHKHKQNRPEDPILGQFHGRKHVQLLKVALGLHMSEPGFQADMKTEKLEGALALVDGLEKDVLRLTSGVGKNELAGCAALIMATLTQSLGQRITRPKLEALHYRDFPNGVRGLEEVLVHLQTIGQIVITNSDPSSTNNRTHIIWTMAGIEMEKKRRNGEIK
jgi:hypothetical protein